MTYQRVCNYINRTGGTSGAGTAYRSGTPEFTPVSSGVRVTRSLAVCVCLYIVDCPFSFGRCVLRFTDSDYTFGIFKLFLQKNKL